MNCKPGDLAYLAVSESAANMGAVLEVLRLNPTASGVFGCPTWDVRACRPLENAVVMDIEGNCEDYRLRPISGVPVEDEVTDDLEITA